MLFEERLQKRCLAPVFKPDFASKLLPKKHVLSVGQATGNVLNGIILPAVIETGVGYFLSLFFFKILISIRLDTYIYMVIN